MDLSSLRIKISNRSNFYCKLSLIIPFPPTYFSYFSSLKAELKTVFRTFLIFFFLCFFFLCFPPVSTQSPHSAANYSVFSLHSSSTQIWSITSSWSCTSHIGGCHFFKASVIASSDCMFGR